MVENVELYDDGRDQEEFNQGTGNDPFQDAFLAVVSEVIFCSIILCMVV